jgi:hypothetical protein
MDFERRHALVPTFLYLLSREGDQTTWQIERELNLLLFYLRIQQGNVNMKTRRKDGFNSGKCTMFIRKEVIRTMISPTILLNVKQTEKAFPCRKKEQSPLYLTVCTSADGSWRAGGGGIGYEIQYNRVCDKYNRFLGPALSTIEVKKTSGQERLSKGGFTKDGYSYMVIKPVFEEINRK